ncbi:glycerate kinase [Maribacter sp. 2307ULW6-5]|uniref:glycerate kinase n=1 Tax=Maribacter sp. 2307ULW6-5 TaxID=3386275 RepID=UPI0039BC269C
MGITFLLAPDKFKGSLDGFMFCKAVKEGISMVYPDAVYVEKPLADGGDGTLDAVAGHFKGSWVNVEVFDPLFRKINTNYLYCPEEHLAFIELSKASGYRLLRASERNCMHTTSYGTGQLIAHALEMGATQIVLGIGGSATNDGGMGIAAALGYVFYDARGRELQAVGKNLRHISHISDQKCHPKLANSTIKVACDVLAPLYGPDGAAHVYAPQKGASQEEVHALDLGLRHLANLVMDRYGLDLQKAQGAGAAGGIGGGMMAFCNASLHPGIDLVKELVHFNEALNGVDWVISGEGRLDEQTLQGKTLAGVMQSACEKGVPVAAFCGEVLLSAEQQRKWGLDYAVSILKKVGSMEQAKEDAYNNLVFAAHNFVSLLKKP